MGSSPSTACRASSTSSSARARSCWGTDAGRLEGLAHPVGHGVELVASVDPLAQGGVLTAVSLGVLDHPVDLLPAERGGLANCHLLLGTGVFVARRDMQDAVGVDVEGHLDLGHSAGAGRIFSSRNRASTRLSPALSRSP